MRYSAAIDLILSGECMARKGWNGKGMFVFNVPGSTFEVNRKPLLGIFPAGTRITYGSHIDIFAADGTIRPWIASQADQAANDWEAVDKPSVDWVYRSANMGAMDV